MQFTQSHAETSSSICSLYQDAIIYIDNRLTKATKNNSQEFVDTMRCLISVLNWIRSRYNFFGAVESTLSRTDINVNVLRQIHCASTPGNENVVQWPSSRVGICPNRSVSLIGMETKLLCLGRPRVRVQEQLFSWVIDCVVDMRTDPSAAASISAQQYEI